MSVLAGPFAIASSLLVAAGVLKAARPADTARALGALGWPGTPALVRMGGAAEAVIGAFALATGAWPSAVLVAVSYAAFAAFVVTARRRSVPLSSCGCFGKVETPPTAVHVVVDVVAVVAAGGAAIDGRLGLPTVIGSQPLAGIPFAMLVIVGAYLTFVSMTALPRLFAVIHGAA